MDIQPLDIVIHMINIVVLYALLRVVLYRPVLQYLRGRSEAVQSELAMAEKVKAEANQLKQSYDARMKEAEAEARKILVEGNQKANDSATSIVESAQRQADELIEKAHENALAERKDMIASFEHQITDMAVSLAGEILKREVKQEDNSKVIETFFNELG